MTARIGMWMAIMAIPTMAAGAVSPSKAFKSAETRLGMQNVGFPPGPAEEGPTTSGAPYLYVPDAEGGDTERLPLKETSADVTIAGVIARVQLKQRFENNGQKPIEAIYVFPASTRAAVHGMTMRIGERTIVAKIDKREQARADYEAAKTEGKRASLLEQQRPNVFTMNVANLMPGDIVEVSLDYSELLVPEDAVYELVVPTVVGPRYAGGTDPDADKWIANPYLSEGQAAPYRFSLKAHLETGIAIKELSSPSHGIDANYVSPSSVDLKLKDTDGGNRDFVLRYRLAGDKIETGLLAFKGEKENFFALMMEPPAAPAQKQIVPREYIFLFDVSGSMHGFPLDTAKELAKNLIQQLKPTDTFNLVFFSGAAYVMNPGGSIPATSSNVSQALTLVGNQRGGGGTELMGGLKLAYAVPKKESNVSRSVILVTDGFVGVEAQAFKFVRENLTTANLFAFGIGSSVNRGLIEGLARAGQGEPFVVLDPSKAAAEAEKLRKYVEQPVMSGVEVKFSGFAATEVAPAKLPDLMARRPLIVFGKFDGAAKGSVVVTGSSAEGPRKLTLDLTQIAPRKENEPLKWLWARKWVEILDDERALAPAKELDEAVVDLGLTYSLLTNLTSFVAIDSEVVNRGGAQAQVKQPLPLPQGVSDYAVAGSANRAMKTMVKPRVGGVGIVDSLAPAAPMGRIAMDEQASKDVQVACAKVQVTASESRGIVDVAKLVAAVKEKLEKALPVGCADRAALQLRVKVDGTGKLVEVVLESGDKRLGEKAKNLLKGLVTPARAAGPSGMAVLKVTIAP